jgi:hypothetical protein
MLQQYIEALDSYDRALGIEKVDLAQWNNIKIAKDLMGIYKKNQIYLAESPFIDDDDFVIWEDKGITLSRLGKEMESNVCFEVARILNNG